MQAFFLAPNALAPSDDLRGEKTSAMFGLGSEYRPTPTWL
jgi:hypothetical protein